MNDLNKIILLCAIILIVTIVLYNDSNKQENFVVADGLISNEALQNISSVYANKSSQVTFNNMIVTGQSQLNTTTITDLKVSGTSNVMPKGGIIAWSGDITKIPETWALCDGKNGTPNLSGKFILGVGQYVDACGNKSPEIRNMNDTGGEEKHKLLAKEMPPHNHFFGTNCSDNKDCTWPGKNGITWTPDRAGPGQFPNTPRADSLYSLGNIGGVAYTSIGGGDVVGDDGITQASLDPESYFINPNDSVRKNRLPRTIPHNNMPPYYVLAYIIKL